MILVLKVFLKKIRYLTNFIKHFLKFEKLLIILKNYL